MSWLRAFSRRRPNKTLRAELDKKQLWINQVSEKFRTVRDHPKFDREGTRWSLLSEEKSPENAQIIIFIRGSDEGPMNATAWHEVYTHELWNRSFEKQNIYWTFAPDKGNDLKDNPFLVKKQRKTSKKRKRLVKRKRK